MAESSKGWIRSLLLIGGVGFLGGLIGGVVATVLTLLALRPDLTLSELRRAPDEVVKVGETLRLRSDSGRPIMQAFASRQVLRVSGDGDRANPAMVTLEAMSPGLTTLTLVDDQGAVTKVRILVEP